VVHALDSRIEKRFSHGFLMLVNFQWSKANGETQPPERSGSAIGKEDRRRRPSYRLV